MSSQNERVKQKMVHLFKIYDYNKNNVLEPSDVEAIARQYAEMNGLAEGSDEYNKCLEMEQGIMKWIKTKGLAVNPERVTMDEYVKAWEAWIGTPEFDTYIIEYAEHLFDSTDTNKNGVVEFDEFVPLIYSDDKDYCRNIFNGLDTDKNGVLSRAEFTAAYRGYFTATDREDPANFIFGFPGFD